MAARSVGRLTSRQCINAKPPKGMGRIRLPDGGNLFLRAYRSTANPDHITRSWEFNFELDGKRGFMGLGPLHTVSLAEARDKARSLRQLLLDGINPLTERRKQEQARKAEQAKQITFERVALDYIALHEPEWKSQKHRDQWRSSLTRYTFPKLGKMLPQQIDQPLIFDTVQPLWETRTVTASRVLNRIEMVLDYAASRGLRSGGDNPARHVLTSLPKRSKVAPVEHHAAVAYEDIPQLMLDLAVKDTVATRAIRFAILTAARAGEVLGATLDEMDVMQKVWTVPAARMKAGVEHRVPLSNEALSLLQDMPRKGRIFNYNTGLAKVLSKYRPGMTVHGLRSSFRQWAHERTNFPDHVAEVALAHKIGGDVERAYKRKAELFERRRKLMDQWARYCASKPVPATAVGTNVIGIGAA
jgi:integrase